MKFKKLSKRELAIASGRELVDRVIALGARCMEQNVDRVSWVFMERWLLPNGVGLMLIYNENYREVFAEVAPFTNSWSDTDAALAKLAALTASGRLA